MNKQSEKSNEDRLMTLKEFVAKLGVDRRTLYRMIDRGEVPRPIKQGKLNYFFESDLLNYFNHLKAQRS